MKLTPLRRVHPRTALGLRAYFGDDVFVNFICDNFGEQIDDLFNRKVIKFQSGAIRFPASTDDSDSTLTIKFIVNIVIRASMCGADNDGYKAAEMKETGLMAYDLMGHELPPLIRLWWYAQLNAPPKDESSSLNYYQKSS